ncbi:pyridoxamine 5'-phosphate oxidase family protein [Nocardioides sp.]|uniref:pyridoxamine 5'-phosphate oxidase family protein n=1 Tax=Nocardioides sp. TaxID=35761 RepID=UPI002C6B7910|nr:pyridoxamine 5'-phosphate oxidase family protein [Nocardioides sp.]HXH80633.1 pyridoxamine 5'-phosphate oxidase family protein [Nocardioides sp.]
MAEPRSRQERIADTLRRLDDDTDAWVASTDAKQPWLAPLSFLWRDGELLLATEATTPTATNAVTIPYVRLAIGHTRDVVIVQGQARVLPATDITDEEADAYQTKHGSDPRTWGRCGDAATTFADPGVARIK